MSESASAKIAVVIAIGVLGIGAAAARNHYQHAAKTGPDAAQVAPVAPAPTAQAGGLPTSYATAAQGLSPPSRGMSESGRVALFEACAEGDQARVEALLAKGVNLDGTLASAATSGNAALVAWLIAHGVSPKEDDDLAVPPLLLADEHAAVVSLLLGKGAREPTLAKAVAAAAPNAVVRLLGKGASASSKASDGEPVLMVAVRDSDGAKRRVMVDALLKGGADPSVKYEDETALSLAVASVVAKSEESEKPGDRAIDLVSKLVGKGAKVDGEMLSAALGADEDKRGALLDALLAGSLERGATATAVAAAAERDDVASLKKIAAKGVVWSRLDGLAATPLANAIIAGDAAMVKALLDVGAPLDQVGEDGDTALLAAVAAAAGDSDEAMRVVRILLDHGASPNKRGRDGRTALFAAAQQGSEGLVTLLVSKGARVDDAVDGMTPLEAADARGYDGVVKLLRARGAKRARQNESPQR